MPEFRGMSKGAIAILTLLCLWPVTTAGVQTTSSKREVAQIAELLQLSERTVLADVGAGSGLWTFLLAKHVSHLFATDVKSPQVNGIQGIIQRRGLTNVTVILGTQQEIGLPANCCDAMLLRLVYHAFRDPTAMRESMRRAMKSRGLILIVDFEPTPEQLSREMKVAGFEQVQLIEQWQSRQDIYAVLFRKAEQ
jgi:ubiquinone/menaquinone biosynthesis C-methylase UbiE